MYFIRTYYTRCIFSRTVEVHKECKVRLEAETVNGK